MDMPETFVRAERGRQSRPMAELRRGRSRVAAPPHCREADLCDRSGSAGCRRPRLVRRDGAGAARPHRRPLAGEHARRQRAESRKRVYYLSLEFLPGRMLLDSLNNAGLTEPMRQALAELGVDLDRLRTLEPDPALGNGGLGRLAACFMESMASLWHSRARLRHPLQPRPVPAGDPRRLAARISGELAVARAIRGSSSGRTSATISASAAAWTARARRRRSGIRRRR